MNEINYLDQIRNAPNFSDGLKKTVQLDVLGFRTAAGLVLTASTDPKAVALETAGLGLQTDANGTNATALGAFTWQVPLDYDEESDYLKLKCMTYKSDSNTASIDASVYVKRAGAAIGSDLNPTAATISATAVATVEVVSLDLSGLNTGGLEAGDVLTFKLTAPAHAGNIILYGAALEYKSMIRSFDQDNA